MSSSTQFTYETRLLPYVITIYAPNSRLAVLSAESSARKIILLGRKIPSFLHLIFFLYISPIVLPIIPGLFSRCSTGYWSVGIDFVVVPYSWWTLGAHTSRLDMAYFPVHTPFVYALTHFTLFVIGRGIPLAGLLAMFASAH